MTKMIFTKALPLSTDKLYMSLLDDGTIQVEIKRDQGLSYSVYLRPEEALVMTAKVTTAVFPYSARSEG